jgi:hypothetical protein
MEAEEEVCLRPFTGDRQRCLVLEQAHLAWTLHVTAGIDVPSISCTGEGFGIQYEEKLLKFIEAESSQRLQIYHRWYFPGVEGLLPEKLQLLCFF